jgi:hypothetical protein
MNTLHALKDHLNNATGLDLSDATVQALQERYEQEGLRFHAPAVIGILRSAGIRNLKGKGLQIVSLLDEFKRRANLVTENSSEEKR